MRDGGILIATTTIFRHPPPLPRLNARWRALFWLPPLDHHLLPMPTTSPSLEHEMGACPTPNTPPSLERNWRVLFSHHCTPLAQTRCGVFFLACPNATQGDAMPTTAHPPPPSSTRTCDEQCTRFRQSFLFFIVYNNIKLITNIYIYYFNLFANLKTCSVFCTGGATAQNSPWNTCIILKCPYISVLEPSCKEVQIFFSAEFPGLTNQGPVRDSYPGAPLG